MRHWERSCLVLAAAALASNIVSAFVINSSSEPATARTATKLQGIDDATAVGNESKSKEDLFVDWMLRDSYEEVPYPGAKLEIQGAIPSYVSGKYIKNGPGAFSPPGDDTQRYTHAFDGLAKLQKFDVHDGEVTFVTRFLRGNVYKSVMEKGKIPGGVYVGPVDPPGSVWEGIMGAITFDNTCVNLADLSNTNTFVATTDASVQMEFDSDTLETIGKRPEPKIRGVPGFGSITLLSTAHGKTGKDGCFYNYFIEQNFLKGGAVRCHIVRTNKDLSHTSIGYVEPEDGRMPYVHEISLTENYAVVVLYPMFYDLEATVSTDFAVMKNLKFDETTNAKVLVFDLRRKNTDGGDNVGPVASFETQPCYAYHHVNAFEDPKTGKVVLDIVGYENGKIANGAHAYLYMENMKTEENRMKQERTGSIWRFEMDLKEDNGAYIMPIKKVVKDDVTNLSRCLELVTVNPELLGKPYRYAYGFTGFARGKLGYLDWALVKQDVSDDSIGNHGIWMEEFMYPSEPMFVADPDGKNEDDGALLSTVYDSKRGENFLLVLDASNMKELARAYTGIGFPTSFHGKFFPNQPSL